MIGSNLMFDLSHGYYMYHNEEEFVSMLEKALDNGKNSPNDCKEVLECYNWNSVAKKHSELFKENF